MSYKTFDIINGELFLNDAQPAEEKKDIDVYLDADNWGEDTPCLDTCCHDYEMMD